MPKQTHVTKKVLLGTWTGLTVLSLFGGATAIQAVPVFLLVLMITLEIKSGSVFKVPVLILSIIMLIINIVEFSLIDITMWLATILVYVFKK